MKQALQEASHTNIEENIDEYAKIIKVANEISTLLVEFSRLDKVDKRKLAIAKTNFEQASLWLTDSLT